VDLWSKLTSLVRESGDPWLALYVMNNLGKGVPPQSRYYGQLQRWRVEMRTQLVSMVARPLETRKTSFKTRVERLPERIKAELVVAENLPAQQEMLETASMKLKLDAQAIRELGPMVRELAKAKQWSVAEKLKDPAPLTRWAAVQVAGHKRLHLEEDLIGLLSDPYPLVRQAARQALVRLSRGNDFGPLPTATGKQLAQSAQAWRQWHRLQDPPEALAEPLPDPLPDPDYSPGRIVGAGPAAGAGEGGPPAPARPRP
jgi:hypothetical protein